MTVYFSNKVVIDLDVIRTVGVNIKENDNPIGYFGTGLKIAICVLLRTGHKVVLHRDGENIEFTTRQKNIRGKEFQMIYMEDEQLSFTTDYGKNWEVWMAYRELHSNCIDEMGRIARTPVEGSGTIWAISGPDIEIAFDNRSQVFLSEEPAWTVDGLEIYRGASRHLFYRGIRVAELPKQTRFTYNFLTPMVLTEDRTLSSVWDANYKAGCRLPKVADPEFCSKVVDPSWDGYESSFDFSDCADPSEEMLDAIEKVKNDARLNSNTKNLLKNKRRQVVSRDDCVLSEAEKQTLENSLIPLPKLNCNVKIQDVHVVEFLGENIEGLMEDDEIYIARSTVAKGTEYLSSTIYEEWIHKTLGFKDKTRGLQQFLFDKIFQLVKELP